MKPYGFITGVLLALSLLLIACSSGATPTAPPWPTERPASASSSLGTVPRTRTFRLTILHNTDGESQLVNLGPGFEEYGGVDQFAAVVQREKRAAASGEASTGKNGVIMLSGGDNFLAGPEFSASLGQICSMMPWPWTLSGTMPLRWAITTSTSAPRCWPTS